MKYYLLLISIFNTLIFASEHYAKVQALERTTIKATASGEVLDANLSLEGRAIKSARVVHIDDRLDIKDLNHSIKSLELLKANLALTKEMLTGLKESWIRQANYYERLKSLSTASQTQKDQAYEASVNAQNQYLSTQINVVNLERSILDMSQKISTLKDRISKKSLWIKNRYLYRLLVRKREFVAMGTPLAIVDNLTKAKLVIYLSLDELKNLSKSHIWIDGKKSNLKFSKIWKETDDKYLSSYRAELEISPEIYPFSSLVKVELK